MKKTGILNRDIARILATLGHTDHIVIADCGLPIPSGVECIDLSLRKGFPSFTDVLEEVLEDMEVEAMIAAEEVKDQNHIYTAIESKGIPTYFLPHQDLKVETAKAKAVIRTGEVTPFANVILRAGVLF